ncbi:hypothetical protein GA707_03260 [Nostocoides sp. F2B08]|uniref:hypothetical protein n=1 Tax=Nostocoides sp. F2B08 TaxID=2653936 RepID=UPI001263DD3D|nr:hypothetical protein [Tetrasphaera sp. F2B08]KAB7746520.1 hypothetical protein GA707_03260 [Tetrasphaera sp. F2B08]
MHPATVRHRSGARNFVEVAGVLIHVRTMTIGATILTVMIAALTASGCGAGDGSSSSPSSPPILSDTTGDAPFYLESVSVRVAESFPVQLFLDVAGSTPTPCHSVAYAVEKEDARIDVTITSQSAGQSCTQVLDPRQFVVPLGPSDLPVTVDVNEGEYTETVRP